MELEIIYPAVEKKRMQRKKLLAVMRWPFLLAAVICPVMNIVTGGKAWSLVVLMSLYMAWNLLLSTDLVEYNRISQFIKLICCSCILLAIIDIFLAPGWAIEVVPIVCFCALTVSGVLFFTDFERQKQNMLPLLFLIFLCLGGAVLGLCLWHEESRWALAVMGVFALVLLSAVAVSMGSGLLRELRRRFHTK